jgi:hypothetical protein
VHGPTLRIETVPFELRARLAYDGALLGSVGRIFVDSVLGFYRRKVPLQGSSSPGKSGAVTVVQRVNADLRLNPHFHSIALDGVFAPNSEDDTLVFHALPQLDPLDVCDLLAVIRARVLRFLLRRGVIEGDEALTVLPDGMAEREPLLARLAAAAVSGLPPAGPERRNGMQPLALGGRRDVEMAAPLAATSWGFSLHAATTAAPDDERGREALVRYVLRPPIAQEKLELLDDDLVRIHLRRPFADGTVAVDIDPLSLLCRLCAAIPPPRFNTVRYSGVLAPASQWRPRIVPPLPERASQDAAPGKPKPPTHRCGWRPWHELMKRSFDVDRQCPACGGSMKLKGVFTTPQSIDRMLRHLGGATETPRRAPARDPPSYKSRVLRRRAGELA